MSIEEKEINEQSSDENEEIVVIDHFAKMKLQKDNEIEMGIF